jgi:hypothetical protein
MRRYDTVSESVLHTFARAQKPEGVRIYIYHSNMPSKTEKSILDASGYSAALTSLLSAGGELASQILTSEKLARENEAAAAEKATLVAQLEALQNLYKTANAGLLEANARISEQEELLRASYEERVKFEVQNRELTARFQQLSALLAPIPAVGASRAIDDKMPPASSAPPAGKSPIKRSDAIAAGGSQSGGKRPAADQHAGDVTMADEVLAFHSSQAATDAAVKSDVAHSSQQQGSQHKKQRVHEHEGSGLLEFKDEPKIGAAAVDAVQAPTFSLIRWPDTSLENARTCLPSDVKTEDITSLSAVGVPVALGRQLLSSFDPSLTSKVSRKQIELTVNSDNVSVTVHGVNPSYYHASGEGALVKMEKKDATPAVLKHGDAIVFLTKDEMPMAGSMFVLWRS